MQREKSSVTILTKNEKSAVQNLSEYPASNSNMGTLAPTPHLSLFSSAAEAYFQQIFKILFRFE